MSTYQELKEPIRHRGRSRNVPKAGTCFGFTDKDYVRTIHARGAKMPPHLACATTFNGRALFAAILLHEPD